MFRFWFSTLRRASAIQWLLGSGMARSGRFHCFINPAVAPLSLNLLFLFPAALNPAALTAPSISGKAVFEFRGRITFRDVNSFRGIFPVVFIQGALTPFSHYTRADGSGRFKFSHLRPAMYVLTIAVPGRGEMVKTVNVGPGTANTAGIVEESFVFTGQISPEGSHRIAASQLTIPKAARQQYERALKDLGKPEVGTAQEKLKKAIELAPQFVEAWNQLGVIAYHSKEYAGAERCFREALKYDPESFSPLVNLGGALVSQGKKEEALPINQQAVRMAPGDPLPQSQLGINYFLLNQLELAEKHLRQAKVLDSRHFSHPQLVLAEIYRLQNKQTQCLEELTEFLALHPDSPAAAGVRLLVEKLSQPKN
jgi:Tfp pilus assembly protein PilF